ncbi:hypothetical protein BH09ACT1_BH09ACT1_12070 [soil metagenome]
MIFPFLLFYIYFIAFVKRRPSLRVPGLWAFALFFLLYVLGTFAYSSQMPGAQTSILLAATGLPAYLFAANMSHAEVRWLIRTVVALAAIETGLVALESTRIIPAIFRLTFDNGVTGVQQGNTILKGNIRGTGTMAHALPFGFLVITACAMVTSRNPLFRTPWALRILMFAIAAAGCIYASARSSLVIVLVLGVITLPIGKPIARGLQAVALAIIGLFGLISSGFFTSTAVNNLLDSGSVYHRVDILQIIPHLFGLSPVHFLLGQGKNAASLLTSYLPNDGLLAIDNQLLSAFLTTGLFGLAFFVTMIVRAFRRGRGWRLVLVSQLSMFGIFDLVLWQSSLALFAAVLGMLASGTMSGTRNSAHQLRDAYPHFAGHGTSDEQKVASPPGVKSA